MVRTEKGKRKEFCDVAIWVAIEASVEERLRAFKRMHSHSLCGT